MQARKTPVVCDKRGGSLALAQALRQTAQPTDSATTGPLPVLPEPDELEPRRLGAARLLDHLAPRRRRKADDAHLLQLADKRMSQRKFALDHGMRGAWIISCQCSDDLVGEGIDSVGAGFGRYRRERQIPDFPCELQRGLSLRLAPTYTRMVAEVHQNRRMKSAGHVITGRHEPLSSAAAPDPVPVSEVPCPKPLFIVTEQRVNRRLPVEHPRPGPG